MLFKADKNLVVWDADMDKALCKFDENGECETGNSGVIAKLISLGYEHDGSEEDEKFISDLTEAYEQEISIDEVEPEQPKTRKPRSK